MIVTAALSPEDFVWFDEQRKMHFPPERNQLGAHLTMFHALPPSTEDELRGLLKSLARQEPPRATVSGVMNLGKGVAYRIQSPALASLRVVIADHFHGSLTVQDDAGWRPHVTIQNKVRPDQARLLFEQIDRDFVPRSINIHGLALNRYLGGPWEPLGSWAFRP